MSLTRHHIILALFTTLPFYALNAQAFDSATPEIATDVTANQRSVHAEKFIAATANPHATQAAYDILKASGSAVDAAIAAQMVLGLTEPQSSGVGGGAFLLTFDGKRVRNYDGRETAPAKVDENLFRTPAKTDMAFYDAVIGGRSVGVPGAVAMLAAAHQREGKLPWAKLFQPAIDLATRGFIISPRMSQSVQADKYLMKDPTARAYFYQADGVTAKPAGTLLQNPEYAAVLKAIAQRGAKALYTGPIAQSIVDKVHAHPSNPGYLSMQDLAKYRPKIRTAVCGKYRDYTVCGPDAPSSGGVAVIQMLGLLERFNLSTLKPTSAQAIHYFSESGRLAFADRGKYLADPDFVSVPTKGLIDPIYLQRRAELIRADQSLGTAVAGKPAGAPLALLETPSPERISTSHIAIIDAQGHAVSMTSSVEDAFGARQMINGFLLNNQLTDFNFSPTDKDSAWVANRVQPNKRPRSSMAPVLVFDASGKKLQMVVGSPGGSRIIGYVTQTLVNLIDWKMDPQTAVNMPHYGSRNGSKTEIEKGTILLEQSVALTSLGHEVVEAEMTSGLAAIVKTPQGYAAGVDARREGVAKGE